MVKPNEQGSTIGITIVRRPEEMAAALELAFKYDQTVLIEQFVEGIEITAALIGNRDPQVLPLIEIVPNGGFYDYERKYTPGATEEIVPARIPESQAAVARELAARCHRVFGCRGMSRVDMIVGPDQIWVLEINTIPGMTPTSLLPRAAAAAGIPFPQLVERLIDLALEGQTPGPRASGSARRAGHEGETVRSHPGCPLPHTRSPLMPDRSPNRRRLRRWRPKPGRSSRNRRRANPSQVAGRVILTILAAQALWTAFHAPQLRVRRVEVVGANRLGAARVAKLAGVPLGRNIFGVNLFRARMAVETDPLVESASVTRALPDAVRILVRERRPVFTVSYAGRYFEADGAGVLFRRVPKPTPRLPRLGLRNVGPVHLGGRLSPSIMNPSLACLRLTARDRMLLCEIDIDGPHGTVVKYDGFFTSVLGIDWRPSWQAVAHPAGPARRPLTEVRGCPEDSRRPAPGSGGRAVSGR